MAFITRPHQKFQIDEQASYTVLSTDALKRAHTHTYTHTRTHTHIHTHTHISPQADDVVTLVDLWCKGDLEGA